MGKHKKMGGIWFTSSKGTTFKKKASATNICVGKAMKDKEFPNRKAVQVAFINALDGCDVNLSAKTRKKFGLSGGKKTVGRPKKAQA